MAMIWDSVLAGAVAAELREKLVGSRLQAHAFDWDRRLLTLFLREATLRWDLHPSSGWVQLDPPESAPSDATPLAAEVRDVVSPPDERVISIHLRKVRGRERRIRVVMELMTNQWNALLLEGDDGWIRHLLWTRHLPHRSLASGQAYRPPPPSGREGIGEPVSVARFDELIRLAREGEDDREVLDRLAFASPLNLPALMASGGDGYRSWIAYREGSNRSPCILESTKDKHPYPYIIKDLVISEQPSILEAIREVSEESPGPGTQTLDRIQKALHQARGRVRGLVREMDQAADPERFRERANLLLARLGEVSRGAANVTLTGFSGEEVTLDLDPSMSPHENAQVLYEEAARQERAQKRLPALLEKAQGRVAELDAMREGLSDGSLSEEDVLPHLPAPKAGPRWQHKDSGPRLPYRRFRSSGGLEIRVGRGSSDNDALTFKHSHPDDVWLHAREAGGAHVVLRWNETGAPPGRDLEEAAILAALHSKARGSKTVPVDWTRRKYVRKPRKAPPGTVTLERGQTLYVEPDSGVPERLAWEE